MTPARRAKVAGDIEDHDINDDDDDDDDTPR